MSDNNVKAGCTEPDSTCGSCGKDDCASRTAPGPAAAAEPKDDDARVAERLSRIKRTYIVLSGKGGVGKSTVAVNTAAALALEGFTVGLLDADIHGPSVPTMLALQDEQPQASDGGILPIEIGTLKVISIGFFLKEQDNAVIWRGPMKMAAIKQFIGDVDWGDLDYLVVDLPPGTGDEPLSICQLIGKPTGAIVVTTPQEVAASDVRKSISFCRQLNVPVTGVVENMSGFVCPHCGTVTNIFSSGGGKALAEQYVVPFLASIPIDPVVGTACDEGTPFVHKHPDSPAAKAFEGVVKALKG